MSAKRQCSLQTGCDSSFQGENWQFGTPATAVAPVAPTATQHRSSRSTAQVQQGLLVNPNRRLKRFPLHASRSSLGVTASRFHISLVSLAMKQHENEEKKSKGSLYNKKLFQTRTKKPVGSNHLMLRLGL